MSSIKQLAGQTAIYGIPTIVGRFLNYLLVPLYTYKLAHPSLYGEVSELYAYAAFLAVLLTYGMETAFFRFVQKIDDKQTVFDTSVLSIFTTTMVFLITTMLFAPDIAVLLKFNSHIEYIRMFIVIVSLDALRAIPFARLRQQNKAKRFAAIKVVEIVVNIGLNLFFLVLCPYIIEHNSGALGNMAQHLYSADNQIRYIFISNLCASAIACLLLLPEFLSVRFKFDKKVWREMIGYALPVMIFGFAGIINETFDRIALKDLIRIPSELQTAAAETQYKYAMAQVGIYSACYKVSIIISLFIQAFRFAAEPFFFNKSKDKDSKQTYADVMKYFVIFLCFVFVGVTMYLNIVLHFVKAPYRVGRPVVPILLMANIFLGMYYNLSIWYKLTDQTKFGAYISVFGACITLGGLWVLVPWLGYIGAAWATFICYLVMMIVSYFLGQKYFPVPYSLRKILFYIFLAVGIFFLAESLPHGNTVVYYSVRTLFFIVFAVIAYVLDLKPVLKRGR